MTSIQIDEATKKLFMENPEARLVAIKEVSRLVVTGDIEEAKVKLRMIINLTCGFPTLSCEVGRHPKSIMRMLTPDIDPGIKAFMSVVKATERQIVRTLEVFNDAQ